MSKKRLMATAMFTMTTTTWACNASHVLGAGGAGAVYTISANTMQEGSLFIGINSESVQNKSLLDTQMITAMQNGSYHLHSIDAINAHSFSLSYGMTDKLSVTMQLPYSIRKNIRAGEEDTESYEVHAHGNAQGAGDSSLLFQYKFYDKEVKIALLTGVKVPTGKIDRADAGKLLEADLQPGSGSWDFFAGVAITKEYEKFSLGSNLLYKYNTKGTQNSQLGDVLLYNSAVSYRLYTHEHDITQHEREEEFAYSVDLFVELNGEYAQQDRFSGIVAQNTGHNVIFATTGLNIATESGYAFFVAFSIPVYQTFNGLQNEISYKTSFGLGMSF